MVLVEVELVVQEPVPGGQLGYHYALLEGRQKRVPGRREDQSVLVLQPGYVVDLDLQLLVGDDFGLLYDQGAEVGLCCLKGLLDNFS